MRSDTDRTIVSALLDEAGNTYAAQAGIRLKDTPAPLFQLLILALLLSTRISADIAVAAAAELFRARLRSPRAVRAAERRTIIAALGRGHYVRYDERTATRLKNAAARVEDLYRDDLRRLARESDHDVAKATRLLTDFDGIGPVGAAIFLRSRTCGAGFGRTSTSEPRNRPKASGCRPIRTGSPNSPRPTGSANWPQRSSGRRSTRTFARRQAGRDVHARRADQVADQASAMEGYSAAISSTRSSVAVSSSALRRCAITRGPSVVPSGAPAPGPAGASDSYS
ncbi:endonuclease III [Rhodococcus sp. PvR044]|nr:endonuclease III [Rhodococcus sp. PvR099]